MTALNQIEKNRLNNKYSLPINREEIRHNLN